MTVLSQSEIKDHCFKRKSEIKDHCFKKIWDKRRLF